MVMAALLEVIERERTFCAFIQRSGHAISD